MSPKQKLEQAIYRALPDMPPNQKKVAEFFLENRTLVALLSIQDIAQQARVSKASVVRFAQLIGYTGFKELKEEFSSSLIDQLSPTEKYKVATSEQENRIDSVTLVAQNVITNIQETLQYIDKNKFTQAVESIIQAKNIYCLGLELSAALSQLMTFLLCLYHYPAHHMSLDYLRFKEQVAHMNADDLLIAFSFSPYSRETVEAIALAKQKGLSSIAFTDKKIAPIRNHATYTFQIKTDNLMFSNSVGAITVLINAIITELNFRDRERTLKALENIEDNIKDERFFIVP